MFEVIDLNVSYGEAQVLYNASLTVESGQTTFLVGRNGAGKTTLLKTVMGLLNPTGGRIMYEGQDVTNLSPEELYRKGFRYVNQDKQVFSNLTVRDNIELAAHGSRIPPEKAIEQAVSIYPKLKSFLEKNAGDLSGGQRQILLIGQAIVGSPKLMLIDEPTQGLAAVVINDIVKIINKLKNEMSTSILIVAQNLPFTKKIADKVCILKEGKLVEVREDVEEISSLQL